MKALSLFLFLLLAPLVFAEAPSQHPPTQAGSAPSTARPFGATQAWSDNPSHIPEDITGNDVNFEKSGQPGYPSQTFKLKYCAPFGWYYTCPRSQIPSGREPGHEDEEIRLYIWEIPGEPSGDYWYEIWLWDYYSYEVLIYPPPGVDEFGNPLPPGFPSVEIRYGWEWVLIESGEMF